MNEACPESNTVVLENNGQGPALQKTSKEQGAAPLNMGQQQGAVPLNKGQEQEAAPPNKSQEQEAAPPNKSQEQEAAPPNNSQEQEANESQEQEKTPRTKQVKDHLDAFQALFVAGLSVLFALAAGVLLTMEVRKQIVIDPIAVPESLSQQGYTPEIVSARIMDEFRKIGVQEQTRSLKDSKINLTPEEESMKDLEVPGTSFTVESGAEVLRNLLRVELTRIQGDIIQAQDESFELQLRVNGVAIGDAQVTAPEIDNLIHQAALELLRKVDPYIFASYSYYQEAIDSGYPETKAVIEQMLETSPEDDDVWAYNLWSSILVDEGNLDGAVNMLQKAQEIDPELTVTYVNWGHVLRQNEDSTGAVEKYRIAAERGDPLGQNNLGYMYDEGLGVKEEDNEKAVEWYRKAADQDNATGYNNLGTMYQNGEGVKKDEKQAVELYRKAVKLGDATGQYNLAWMYYKGTGVEQNYQEAERLFKLSAWQGNPAAQIALGDMYYKGEGVQQDHEEALFWHGIAAELGYPSGLESLAREQEDANAQNQLGEVYYGYGVEEYYEEGAKWFQRAAEQGNAAALNNLGDMYYYGLGVEQSYEQAAEWYYGAAEQEDATGQYNLAYVYYYGEGVEPNHEQAAYWFELAAQQNHALAQYYLAQMYQEGENYAEAAKWYRQAAEQGSVEAQARLDEMDQEGLVVRKE